MRRKIGFALLSLLAVLVFGGCAVTVDELYCPPKRSEEYNNLQSVIESAMYELSYCAPLAGEYQQTVQMSDLDGDGEQEYLLFAKGTKERPLRILIFRNTGGSYTLVNTIESNGTAFDQVEYVQIDGKGGAEIVVGYQINDQVLRAVTVYTFSGNEVEQLMSVNYTKFLTVDLDKDGRSELFILRPGQTDTDNGIAELYGMEDTSMERSNEVSMSRPADNLKRVIVGQMHGGQQAIYAASAVGETAIITDVYTVNDGMLTNVSFSNESGTSIQTMRNYYVYADDIDNDGIVELPDLISMISLNGLGQPEKQDLIRWYSMKPNGEEVDKLYTYHNFVGGWYIQLESQWTHFLTVQNNGNQYEFYLWNEDRSSADRIFSIYVLTGANRNEQSIESGRFVLHQTDAVIYSASLEDGAMDYGITQESLMERFHMIQQDWKTGET